MESRIARTKMHRIGSCLAALRDLAQSHDPYRYISIERHIDEYLKADPFSLNHALEQLRRAIHSEEVKKGNGEDWSIAKNYIRLLLIRMT
jgi:hypothetical protein